MKLGDHRTTALLLLLSVALLLVMREFFPAELAIPLAGSDIRPVLLLEFATTPSHLVNIFGDAVDPLRAARIEGMNVGNALDYPFMAAYGLMTLSFFFGVSRELGAPVWRLFGWMGVVAGLSDAIENAIMFRMVDDFMAGADVLGEMALLPYPVWLKFGLLALSCGGAAWAFMVMRRFVLAALCLPAPAMFVPGMLDPLGIGPLATTLIGLGWLAMGAHALSRWLRPSPSQSKE